MEVTMEIQGTIKIERQYDHSIPELIKNLEKMMSMGASEVCFYLDEDAEIIIQTLPDRGVPVAGC